MFVLRQRVGRVEVAFTDRHGTGGPLNLAVLHEGRPLTGPRRDDGSQDVDEVAAALGARPVGLRQVHGADVVVLDAELDEQLAAGAPEPEADALVTALPGRPLLVRTADCAPVLLADAAAGFVAAAHCGRQGLVAGVVPRTVEAMRSLGAEQVRAWVGPTVCGRCYEVPAQLRDEVAGVVPEARATTSWGTPALDIPAGVVAQLAADGVEVTVLELCTLEHDDLWSHRREGPAAGRLGGLVQVVA